MRSGSATSSVRLRRRRNEPSSSRSLVISEPVVPGVKLMRGYFASVFVGVHASRCRPARMFVAGVPASRRTLLRLRILFPYTPSIIELSRNARNVNVFIQPPENLGFGPPLFVGPFKPVFP